MPCYGGYGDDDMRRPTRRQSDFVKDDEEDEDDEDDAIHSDEEEELVRDDIFELRRQALYQLAEMYDIHLSSEIKRMSLSKLRVYLADTIFPDDEDEDVAGSIEFGGKGRVEDITTVELLKTFLAQPDHAAMPNMLLLIQSVPYLGRMRDQVQTLAPMLCEVCRLLEHNDIPIPETVNGWWENHKEEDAERVAKRVQELRRVLTDAERAREELDKLIGPQKVNRVIRRVRLPKS